jgi:hypothetical protein
MFKYQNLIILASKNRAKFMFLSKICLYTSLVCLLPPKQIFSYMYDPAFTITNDRAKKN